MKNSEKYGKSYFENYGNNKLSYIIQANNPTFEKRLNELKVLGVNDGRILDVGCAYGYFLRACESRGYSIYGVDISPHAINNAKRNCNGSFKIVDVEKGRIPFRNSSFKVIVLMDVLEHLENPYHLLREVCRLLVKGGFVYIHVPTRSRAFGDKSHKTFFSYDSLLKVLSFFPLKMVKSGEEGGKFSNLFGIVRLIINRDTNFNYVPLGTGSFVSAYFKRL